MPNFKVGNGLTTEVYNMTDWPTDQPIKSGCHIERVPT